MIEADGINMEFKDLVKRYCAWVEGGCHDVQIVRELLPRLMLEGPILRRSPEVERANYARREHKGWQEDFQRFKDMPFDYYHAYFTPLNMEEPEPVVGSLADDLADIYGDLWHGLQAMNAGDEAYAVNYWHSSYFFHWGEHASRAFGVLDQYFRENHERHYY